MIQQLNPNVLAPVALRLAICLDQRNTVCLQALKKMLVPILLLCGEFFSQFAVIYVITLVKTASTKPAH